MIKNWIENNKIRTAKYWNDPVKEKTKVFNISDNNVVKLEEDVHLKNIYNHLLEISNNENISFKEKSILSLASGTGWLEGRFLRDKKINKLSLVDFSKHRIHELSPKTLKLFGFDLDRVDLVYGNILDLKIKDNTQDIILLSQAFHHIDEPIKLLNEIKRVMKDDGMVIILGEHYHNWKIKLNRILKHYIKYFLNYKKYRKLNTFFPEYKSLFPPCYIKGDIHYSKLEYHHLFTSVMFDYNHYIHNTKTIQAFVLKKIFT